MKINNLENWYEVTRGLYRYVIASKACYELHILYWEDGTDILTAKSSLYIVGNWTSIPEHTSFFSRERFFSQSNLYSSV